MKNFIIIVSFLMVLCACDPLHWLMSHEARWYVKNTTDRPLAIESPTIKWGDKSTRRTIAPGDSIDIHAFLIPVGNNVIPDFSEFNTVDSVYVYSATGTKLKEWIRAKPEKSRPNIYDEPEWAYYENFVGKTYYELTWVFDLTDENLKSGTSAE